MIRSIALIGVFFLAVMLDSARSAEPNEKPKIFRSVKELLEAMPRKPEIGDNPLAVRGLPDWVKKNVVGCTLQSTGKVRVVGHGGRNELRCDVPDLEWRHYDFTITIYANFPESALDDLSRVAEGSQIDLIGRIERCKIFWKSENQANMPGGRVGIANHFHSEGEIEIVLAEPKIKKITRSTPSRSVPTGSARSRRPA